VAERRVQRHAVAPEQQRPHARSSGVGFGVEQQVDGRHLALGD
jgi:hypothetical protein